MGTDKARASVPLKTPADLLGAVPALLGFEPRNCVVITGFSAGEAHVTLRYDLPDDRAGAQAVAGEAAAVLAANGVDTACAVGYGTGPRVTPVADAVLDRLPRSGVQVADALRVEDGRYWSYVCTSPACCPAEGVPFDAAARPAPLRDAPVFSSREELAASIAPVADDESGSLRRAARAARSREIRLAAGGNAAPLLAAGLEAVAGAVSRYREEGASLSHGEAAWLARSLKWVRVRDDAWARMDPAHRDAHLRLWSDLTRLAAPGWVAPAASLLAFTAWQCGNGALANVALDRALADDPRYGMALLLRQALDAGMPPSEARPPMTPEQVAAAYERRSETDRRR